MFGGPPPQATAAEIKAEEDAATNFVLKVIAACVVLYFSPHAVDAIKKLF